jgi:flagellar P-ring protein precursor FlgI
MQITVLAIALVFSTGAATAGVRVKDLGRIEGVRDNMIVGYGIVTGLSGSGDSLRSKATLQSVANALKEFGVNVTADQLSSRNVAAVLVSTTLPAFARPGDKLDASISSMGDARSLTGGTLLMTPLYGPDRKIYALAQGQMTTSSFSYQLNGNLAQKNHPTAGIIPDGVLVEANAGTHIVNADGTVRIVLFNPDYTTANRIAAGINQTLQTGAATALDAGRVEIRLPAGESERIVGFVSRLENITVEPDQRARVIVNERTGTVVSGGDVRLSQVSVAYGDLRVSVVTDYLVSQPSDVLLSRSHSGIRTETVPQTRIDVKENAANSISLADGSTVSDLVIALGQIKTSTRDIIAVLQSIKRAGALHAELIVQ